MNNIEIIDQFYSAFSDRDANKMVSFYHDEITFKDPAFGELKGEKAKEMWRMLIQRSKGNLKISFNVLEADAHLGHAKWTASYVFSKTGRNITNTIDARFEFRDGKIIKHTDSFNLWRWSGQALGLAGWFLGWTPFLRTKIRKETNGLLDKWIAQQA